MSDSLIGVFKVFGRRKIAFQEGSDTRMTRSLFIIDITCLGLSTTLGTGIFTLLAYAAKHETGPSVVLSFLIAAVASCLGGLCYSELSSRFPEGGPSYVYLYATYGEIWAFLIGWSMIFEYIIATALAAKSLTSYLDNIAGGSLVNLFHLSPSPSPTSTATSPTSSPSSPTSSISSSPSMVLDLHHSTMLPGFESQHLDLISVVIIISVGALLISLNLKLSCLINNILVFICSLVITGIVMVALSDMDPENWTAGPGFFPNGVNGIFSAASLCFFSFHGYDIIASIAGETQHRTRIVPVGISLAFLLGLVACFSSSVAITLLIPYSLMDDNAPIIQTFTLRGYEAMKYLIILGATSGLYASLIGTLLGLSRLIFTMSLDGLLPTPLSGYNSTKGTTTLATFLALLLSSIVALTVQSGTLFLWLGLGSLLSYLSVSLAILSLRYGLPDQLPLECTSELVQSDSSLYDSSLSLSPSLTINHLTSSPPSPAPPSLIKVNPGQPHHLQTTTTTNQSIMSKGSTTWTNNNCSTKVHLSSSPMKGHNIINNSNGKNQHQVYDFPPSSPLEPTNTTVSPSTCLLPHSFSDCLLTHRALPSTCDTAKCTLCQGRPCLKPNRTFIKGAKMYGTLDKPKPLTVNFLHDNNTFITSTLTDRTEGSSLSTSSSSSSSHHLAYNENTFILPLDKTPAIKAVDKLPTEKSALKVTHLLTLTIGLMLLMGFLTVHVTKYLPSRMDWWIELLVSGLFTLIVILVILIVRQPRHRSTSRNSIPCVPLLPICAIWMDIHLIICLPSSSWIAFIIWSLLGIFVYMSYSVWHSHEGDSDSYSDEVQELNLSVSLDEESDEIIHCLQDFTDGSSV